MKFVADMHTHTIACTHAYSTITENAKAASERGLSYIAMTDHSVKMPDSPHEWHFCNMRVIPDFLYGVRIIKGIEANLIDYEGRLDINEYIYGNVEFIVASMHGDCMPYGTEEQITSAYLGVLDNPKVFVLGHTDSPDFPFDVEAVTKACKEKNVAIEFNASRFRSNRSIERLKHLILPTCAKNGCSIIVDSVAHFHDKVGAFEQAEALLNEISFTEELVLNADLKRFEYFISSKGLKTNSGLAAE